MVMMSSKNFVKYFMVLVVLFLAFHIVMWETCTKYVLADPAKVGDLARLSYSEDLADKQHKDYSIDLPKRHIKSSLYDYNKSIDLITIGDSFSNGRAKAKNRFYQDYIATYSNINVLNIETSYKRHSAPLETVVYMLNSGLLDEIKPKYLLIESVERFTIQRLGKNRLNMELNTSKEQLKKFFKEHPYTLHIPENNMINTGNYKALLYKILYKLRDDAYFSRIFKENLTKKMFSVGDGKKILIIREAITNTKKTNEDTIAILNDNLNLLSDALKKKGIKLYYMPAVDKFNVYRKYIMNDKLPKSTFFELLRKKKKDYAFIDTKKILSKKIDKGCMDVYYVDDSHWSYRASDEIFSKILFK